MIKITQTYLFILFTIQLSLCVGCSDHQIGKPQNVLTDSKAVVKWDTTAAGLIYSVVHEGTGPIVSSGDQALIHETTQLKNGTMITDTWQMNFPIPFIIDGNQVIEGLNQAVKGMRVGERKKLIVPSSLSKRSSYPEDGRFKPRIHYTMMYSYLK